MEITINHVITLSAETKDFFTTLLPGKQIPISPEAEPAKKAAKATKQVTQADIKEAAAQLSAPPPSIETEINQTPAVTYKMEEVRARAQEIAMKGKRDEVKAAITKMGAENVPKMDPTKYVEFMAELDKISA